VAPDKRLNLVVALGETYPPGNTLPIALRESARVPDHRSYVWAWGAPVILEGAGAIFVLSCLAFFGIILPVFAA